MRGRTNIAGGGMNINAETKEFMVASGENIVAGDFVEHGTSVSEYTLINSQLDTSHPEKISEDLCVILSSNILYLFSTENGRMTIVDAYNDSIVYSYTVLSSGDIIVLTDDSPYLIRLKVVEKSFHYITSATEIPDTFLANTDNSYMTEYGGKLCVFSIRNTSNSPAYMYAYQFDINEDELRHNFSCSYSFGNTNYSYMGQVIAVGGHLYAVYSYNASSVSSTRTYLLGEVNLNQDTGKIEVSSWKRIETDGSQKFISFFDKYIFWGNGQRVCIFNSSTGIISSFDLKNMGFPYSTASNTPYVKFSIIDDSKVVLFVYGRGYGQYAANGVLEINEATGDVSLVSNIFSPTFSVSSSGYQLGVIYLDGIVNDLALMNQTKCHVVSYDPITNQLTDKVEENYVKPYRGGKAIGVAKQSGKSGESIEVYVPNLIE